MEFLKSQSLLFLLNKPLTAIWSVGKQAADPNPSVVFDFSAVDIQYC